MPSPRRAPYRHSHHRIRARFLKIGDEIRNSDGTEWTPPIVRLARGAGVRLHVQSVWTDKEPGREAERRSRERPPDHDFMADRSLRIRRRVARAPLPRLDL